MVIFHSYVKLPEGTACESQRESTKTMIATTRWVGLKISYPRSLGRWSFSHWNSPKWGFLHVRTKQNNQNPKLLLVKTARFSWWKPFFLHGYNIICSIFLVISTLHVFLATTPQSMSDIKNLHPSSPISLPRTAAPARLPEIPPTSPLFPVSAPVAPVAPPAPDGDFMGTQW